MWAADSRGRTEISGYSLFDDFRSELGYTAILTPGTVAGFAEFHRRLCSKPWGDLLAPAIAMARDGLEMTPFVRDFFARKMMPGVPDGMARLKATAACAQIYLHPEGRFFEVGEVLRQPDYARTLERLAADGPEDFYTGRLGAEIAADLEANGAYVTRGDLEGYTARHGEPVRGTYRGFEVASNPPPGSGVTLIQMLQILEHFDLAACGHGSAAHLDLVARAMAAAHVDRNAHLADPDFADVPLEAMLSPDRAAL
jgi:gamma-glutamyltranspeptidase/glutathione hydrolase